VSPIQTLIIENFCNTRIHQYKYKTTKFEQETTSKARK